MVQSIGQDTFTHIGLNPAWLSHLWSMSLFSRSWLRRYTGTGCLSSSGYFASSLTTQWSLPWTCLSSHLWFSRKSTENFLWSLSTWRHGLFSWWYQLSLWFQTLGSWWCKKSFGLILLMLSCSNRTRIQILSTKVSMKYMYQISPKLMVNQINAPRSVLIQKITKTIKVSNQ